MKPIYGFFHAAIMNGERFDSVFKEIIETIIGSKLLESTELLYIGFVGDDIAKFSKIKSELNHYKNILCVHKSTDLTQYEYPTLQELYDRCHAPEDCYVYYCHTKGVSYKSNQKSDIWRKWMLDYTIKDWKRCIKGLEKYNACGFTRHRSAFFSGNYWWAKSIYIKTLPYIQSSIDRLEAERWIGKSSNKNFLYLNKTNEFKETV